MSTHEATAAHANSDDAGAIDPRTGTAGAPQTGAPYEIAPENAHSRLDSKDQRSIANTLKDAEKTEKAEKRADEAHAHEDPTLAARQHGNDPSRGAVKDKELQDEDEEILKRKEEAKQQSKAAHK